jgi:hypothetical protein
VIVNSIDELVKYRWQQNIQKLMIKQPIAIVGMGCRFPGANNPSEFWYVLRDGVNTITKK